jgi:hypothetical protein
MSGHQDRARHEEIASRNRPRAAHPAPRTNASIRLPATVVRRRVVAKRDILLQLLGSPTVRTTAPAL